MTIKITEAERRQLRIAIHEQFENYANMGIRVPRSLETAYEKLSKKTAQ